jgi:hypothetical protein
VKGPVICAIVVLALAISCSSNEQGGRGRPSHADDALGSTPEKPDAKTFTAIDAGATDQLEKDGAIAMKPMTCDDARTAIETRRFVGWAGLPERCSTDAMFGLAFDREEWPERTLGSVATRWHVLDISGYYRPMVSAREGVVVLFDGMNPELDGGWATLAKDLGEPETKLEWMDSGVATPAGEWVYPARGITIFLDTQTNTPRHVAVYASTTLDDYLERLRPKFGKKTHK